MKFYIVDDEPNHIASLESVLREAFPNCEVEKWTGNSWPKAIVWITHNVPNENESVLLLDISLAGPVDLVEEGLRNAQHVSMRSPKVTLLAYSQYRPRAEADTRYRAIFCGAVDKQRLFPHLDFGRRAEAVAYVRSAILEAVAPDSLFDERILVDSYAMRLLNAAFRRASLAELLGAVARDFNNLQVVALTGGYSGAFLLSISGDKEGRAQNVVVKMSRDRKTLEEELTALADHMSELGPLQGCLVTTGREIRPLPSGDVFYFSQAHVPGDDVLSALRKHAPRFNNYSEVLDPLLSILFGCYDNCVAKGLTSPFAKSFPLSRMDVGRFTNSVPFLREIACTMKKKGMYPNGTRGEPEALGREAAMGISQWETFISALGDALTCVQHGDLNPRNVILCDGNRPVLIDLARLRPWPIGYDLARLTLQLRIRLTDDRDHMDHFPEGFEQWVEEPLGELKTTVRPTKSVCPPAAYCENALKTWALAKSDDLCDAVSRSFRIASLWDLIKIVSYGDLSVYKRVWALHECDRLTEQIRTEAGH